MEKGRGSARVIGPAHMSFPHPKGWLMGDTEVELDKLTIKIMTRTVTKNSSKNPPQSTAHWVFSPDLAQSESNVAPLRLYVSIKHIFRLSNIITSGDNQIFI